MRVLELGGKSHKMTFPVSAVSIIEKTKTTNWYGKDKWTIKLFVGALCVLSIDFYDEDEGVDK